MHPFRVLSQFPAQVYYEEDGRGREALLVDYQRFSSGNNTWVLEAGPMKIRLTAVSRPRVASPASCQAKSYFLTGLHEGSSGLLKDQR